MPSQQQPEAEAQAEQARQQNMSTPNDNKPHPESGKWHPSVPMAYRRKYYEEARAQQAKATQPQPQPPQGETLERRYADLVQRNSNLQAVVAIRERQRGALQAQRDDLLAALREYTERQEAEGDPCGLPEYEQARAAIARATSKQGLGGSDAGSISTEGGSK